MRYLAFFAIMLVSKAMCPIQYWLNNESNSFEWFGSRGGFDRVGAKYALGSFVKGTYSFRPNPETSPDKTPQITIEFELISTGRNSLDSVRIKEIKLIPNSNYEELKKETSQMGETMGALFCKGIYQIDSVYENVNYYVLEMLASFACALVKVETTLTSDQKKELIKEFGYGLIGYMAENKYNGATSEKQGILMIKFIQDMLGTEKYKYVNDNFPSFFSDFVAHMIWQESRNSIYYVKIGEEKNKMSKELVEKCKDKFVIKNIDSEVSDILRIFNAAAGLATKISNGQEKEATIEWTI